MSNKHQSAANTFNKIRAELGKQARTEKCAFISLTVTNYGDPNPASSDSKLEIFYEELVELTTSDEEKKFLLDNQEMIQQLMATAIQLKDKCAITMAKRFNDELVARTKHLNLNLK